MQTQPKEDNNNLPGIDLGQIRDGSTIHHSHSLPHDHGGTDDAPVPRETSVMGSNTKTRKNRRSTRLRHAFTNSTFKNGVDKSDRDESQARKLSLIDELFKIPKQDTLSQWPGAWVYIDFVEKEAETFLSGSDRSFLALLNEANPQSPIEVHTLLVHMAEILRKRANDRLGINEVIDELLGRFKISGPDPRITTEVRKDAQQLVFAAVGWFTMVFKPIRISNEEKGFHVHVNERNPTRTKHMPYDSARRSIAGLIRGLENVLPPTEHITNKPKDQISSHLHVSALNYYALETFAKINIAWADSLSEHLVFNRLSRTLMLFRFPSFCALNCIGEEDEHCFSRILAECFSSTSTEQSPSTTILAAYKREVVLSYRLLFGHRDHSRYHFLRVEAKRGVMDEQCDPLLSRLCSDSTEQLHSLPREIWPESCRDRDGNLMEQDVYGIDVDFPLLGPRLLDLQAFCLRQHPSRMRDLWRDRRNPTQWLTLWAVLIIGGVTTILQIVQVFLVIAQLVLQGKE